MEELKIKNRISQINSLDGLISSKDTAKGRISKLEKVNRNYSSWNTKGKKTRKKENRGSKSSGIILNGLTYIKLECQKEKKV